MTNLFIKTPVTFIILFFVLQCNAEKKFNFDNTCQQAYLQITSLNMVAGRQLINQARKQDPDNLIPDLLESYSDFYTLFFNEDPRDYRAMGDNFNKYLDRVNDGPDSSPFYDFTRSIIYLQKACVEIKFGEQWSAGWNFRKAFTLVKENKKKFPSFTPNDLIYGPSIVAAGVIPDGYKWFAGIFGIKGSIKDGVNIMQSFINSSDPWAKLFFNEAAFYYCYVVFYIQNKPEEAFQFIQQKKLDLVNNHMLAYMAANLAINNKQNEYAKNVILNKNPSPAYLHTSIWDFEMGYIKLRHLETAEAAQYFQSYLTHFKGKFYLKDAWEKLGWCYYLQGNIPAAQNALQQLMNNGNTTTDADKQAERDAESGTMPNVLLLKARVLSDGGYNTEAMNVLAGKNANEFPQIEDKLEFVYRLARIYDDMANYNEAIKDYNYTISLGQYRHEYYAARSALQLGLIYEKLGRKDLAIICYQKCLDMEDHEYKDSLDQKAKAGLARCKGE